MKDEDPRKAILERLDSLNKVMPEWRKIDAEAKRLKAEVATLNAKLAATDKEMNSADFSEFVENTLCAW
ncbi:hypothetical protein ACH4UR_19675 [Streptomyces lydicus]|uniref:hypothetical protein n=1 Tax=Streptomyces lydicus TaxID=47763 RepID=UPI0033C29A61